MRQFILFYFFWPQILLVSCDRECSQTICYPRAGDLLIGRESLLRASSTCGLQSLERYCVVTLTDRGRDSKCSFCYSKGRYDKFSSPNSHRIENVVSRLPQDPGRWWQSVNGVHNISIEVAFETEFQFIFTQLRFKTYRPAAMYIERSKDYGVTWQKSAYFSENCARDFPNVLERNRNDITEVSCTSEFSTISPSEGGTVLFVATPSDLHTYDKDWIEKRNDITAITNLRVQFVRLHTFGDWKIDNNPNILNKYYYGVSEWIIRGRCSCYGHASRCQPKNGQTQQKEMVYGVCVCQHNTMGSHCEKCKDFYNDKPWMPAEINSTNECKKCECNLHSTSCHFDPVVFDLSAKKSGGVCDGCLHNTEGTNCERCKAGYYRNSKVAISSIETCLKCKCDPHGTRFPGLCIQETDPEQSLVAGSCMCKENVGGFFCNICKIGYWNFDKNNEKGCTECKCLMMGTIHNQGCDRSTGQCLCKSFIEEPLCNTCKDGYYNLSSTNPSGCSPCGCNGRGSINSGKCDKFSGQCQCKQGYVGRTCNEIKKGWFIDSPRYPLKYREDQVIELPSVSKSGYYNFIITLDTQQVSLTDTYVVILSIDHNTKSSCPNYQDTIAITKDSKKIVVPNKCLVQHLPIVVSVFMILQPSDHSKAPTVIDVIVVPMLSPNSTTTRNALAECLKYPADSMPSKCNFLSAEINSRAAANSDPKSCNCNVTGSMNNICHTLGGQCNCLPNVVGRQCDQCKENSYGFDARGCKACDCEPKGSLNLQCATDTGKCLCRTGVEGRYCNYCKAGFWKFPYCDACKCNSMADICDQTTGQCIDCKSNSFGFNCQQCDNGYYGDPSKNLPCLKCNCPGLSLNLNHSIKCSLIFNTSNYMCVCKPGYKGLFCDECDENHYGNPREKNGRCTPCHCSSNIDTTVPGSCDPRNGECKKCLYNTAGFNCEKCAVGYFGIGVTRTCKKCVCNRLGTDLKKLEVCHHETGKCPCLSNVVGQQCDQCQTGFFNISSGKGCTPCDCDSSNGAFNETCNSLSGQCHCRQSRSGRQCDKCEDGYWGNPQLPQGCKVCRCNSEGSIFNQCDRNTGFCRCRPGITGKYCDSCARGTDGKMPNCMACGDCWLQWDQTIQNLIILLGHLQNGTMGNVTVIGLPQNLPEIINNINKYIDSIKSILKHLPQDLWSQVKKLQDDFIMIKKELENIDSISFNISEYDSTNITNAILHMKEVVAKNKIQDYQGAYSVILKSYKLIIEAVNFTNEAMKLIEKMKTIVSKQEKEMKQMNYETMEIKSKELAQLENILLENLIKFNKWTCNSESSLKNSLCSDVCGGVGCNVNNCSRKSYMNKECLREEEPKFFNSHAYKLNNKINSNNYFKEMEKNPLKDIKGKFDDSKSEISATKRLIGVTNSTINSKYNQALRLLENLKNMVNNSVSEDEFKKLLEAINNFKLQSHEEEIKGLEGEIKTRIQQLNDKVNDVLLKSNENRKDCDLLKKSAVNAEEKATNLLKSIKDLEDNHKLVLQIQTDTKALLSSFIFYKFPLEKEINKIKQNQNETEKVQKEVDKLILILKSLNKTIENTLKTTFDGMVSLEIEQSNLTEQLAAFKIRADAVDKRKDSLNENSKKTKINSGLKREKMLNKIIELKEKIIDTRMKVSNARGTLDIKQSTLKELSRIVEEKLQLISSLEHKIYSKSEFQRSCLP